MSTIPAAMQGIVYISSGRNDHLRQQKYNKVLDLWDFHIMIIALCRIIMPVSMWRFMHPSKLHVSKNSTMPYDRPLLTESTATLLYVYLTLQVRYLPFKK